AAHPRQGGSIEALGDVNCIDLCRPYRARSHRNGVVCPKFYRARCPNGTQANGHRGETLAGAVPNGTDARSIALLHLRQPTPFGVPVLGRALVKFLTATAARSSRVRACAP